MKHLLAFLTKLETHKIHYYLEHNRDDFVMVHVAVPGERWEVEFGANGDVEIEIFSNSQGVFTDKAILERLFEEDATFDVYVTLREGADENAFIDRFIDEAIEANVLTAGGNPLTDGCVVSKYAKGSPSPQARQAVEDWLKHHPDVVHYRVGEIV